MILPLQIGVRNKIIVGMLHVPKHHLPGSPLIIMCYGLDGSRSEVHRMAVKVGRLAEQLGIMTFRFDYRGQGLSEGEFWDVTAETKIEDILELISFFKGCSQNEDLSIILLGFSDGAKIVIQAAVRSSDVSSIVLWSPLLFNMILEPSLSNENIDLRNARSLIKHPKLKKVLYPFTGLWMNTQHLRDLKNEDSINYLNQLSIPKLCILGTNDEFINEDMGEQIIGCMNNIHSTVHHIEGANHVFSQSDWSEEVIKLTLKWIEQAYSSKEK